MDTGPRRVAARTRTRSARRPPTVVVTPQGRIRADSPLRSSVSLPPPASPGAVGGLSALSVAPSVAEFAVQLCVHGLAPVGEFAVTCDQFGVVGHPPPFVASAGGEDALLESSRVPSIEGLGRRRCGTPRHQRRRRESADAPARGRHVADDSRTEGKPWFRRHGTSPAPTVRTSPAPTVRASPAPTVRTSPIPFTRTTGRRPRTAPPPRR